MADPVAHRDAFGRPGNVFGASIDGRELRAARELRSTRFYPATGLWEERDHVIALGDVDVPVPLRPRRATGRR